VIVARDAGSEGAEPADCPLHMPIMAKKQKKEAAQYSKRRVRRQTKLGFTGRNPSAQQQKS
jgi:hypothetical protein